MEQKITTKPRMYVYRAISEKLMLSPAMLTYDDLARELPDYTVSQINLAIKKGMNNGEIREQKIGARVFFGTMKRDYSQWIENKRNPPAPEPEQVAPGAPIVLDGKTTYTIDDKGNIRVLNANQVITLPVDQARRFMAFMLAAANIWESKQ